MTKVSEQLLTSSKKLLHHLEALSPPKSIWGTYNPLEYAWDCHQNYVERFGSSPKKALFLGMNPGPWGMAQTGIPFGEISAVRDWMKVQGNINKPKPEHPARPIDGFDCPKSEVSGRRLWGLFADHWPSADDFFKDHFVLNYCPLSFMSETGSNVTPDKLPVEYRKLLEAICDEHLNEVIEALTPKLLIGVGGFAQKCFLRLKKSKGLTQEIGILLHPSPASPIANREWPIRPTTQLKELGILF